MSPPSESAREREARHRRYRSVQGAVTVGELLALPPSVGRNRLIERLIGQAAGTPGWVLDAWEEAEQHRLAAARDRRMVRAR